MSEETTCKRCGTKVGNETVGGMCPRCLMALNFDSRTMPEGEEAPASLPPLSPEEMAENFPQFEILECLGRGGMGVVYRARQKTLDRMVAIKVLAGEWQGDVDFAERFEREAKTLAQMSHPNIVTVHDFGETNGLYFIVMEFVDGVNLRDLLREGKMESGQALAIVPAICEALEYAHGKGVVHRDIKPENLLLDREGRVKIADFGIASLIGSGAEHTGTPPYMSPEQSAGGITDERVDVYALGVVLYEMLTGERPGQKLVAPSRKVEVDVRIDEMVMRALETEPEKRYQTVGELRTVVETISEQKFPSASLEKAPRDSGKNKSLSKGCLWGLGLGLGALLLLVLVSLILAFASYQWFGSRVPVPKDETTESHQGSTPPFAAEPRDSENEPRVAQSSTQEEVSQLPMKTGQIVQREGLPELAREIMDAVRREDFAALKSFAFLPDQPGKHGGVLERLAVSQINQAYEKDPSRLTQLEEWYRVGGYALVRVAAPEGSEDQESVYLVLGLKEGRAWKLLHMGKIGPEDSLKNEFKKWYRKPSSRE